MDARERPAGAVADSAPVPPVSVSEPTEDLARLGQALRARRAEVLELTGKRVQALGHGKDTVVQSNFERINESSTLGLASWFAGEGTEGSRGAIQEASQLYGEVAAHRAASLREVIQRCICWRDVVAEVLRSSASELNVSEEALTEALNVLQVGLELSLVRMSKFFDSERERTDEELLRREEELTFLATHDTLTSLPNRTLILDRVEQMFARAARSGAPIAALLVGLDNFRAVNDSLGRKAGDNLLQAVAARLDGALRGSDAVGPPRGG